MRSPPGIYQYDTQTQIVNCLTPRDYPFDPEELKSPESITYTSFDGTPIHGWFLPAATDSSKAPGILHIHGGPGGHDDDSWEGGRAFQLLSQLGYNVLAPNYRGSTGYGKEFFELNTGDIGGGDLQDVIHGATWLKSKPEVDSDKIAIMGASYGGYMTLMALTKNPDVFCAGVSIVPVVDWYKMYELSDMMFRDYQHSIFGGPPEGDLKQTYIESSPITHVSNIKSPVMIMAGAADSRCPLEPIQEFVNKLDDLNHSYEFHLEEKAGHASTFSKKDEAISLYQKIDTFQKSKFH